MFSEIFTQNGLIQKLKFVIKKIPWLENKFSMADREGRKAELERKKARLLAMRAEKNKKEVRFYITRIHFA